ncbi:MULTISPECIES: hypothetical protein [Bacillus]|uniref:hypothetical protein n=1 Tax=Bacillus TaxID=1386 RepID=UPI00099CD8DA|nr:MULTISPECIES: hypothetical protein [Bacillus amyloliquefaciens group]ASZ03869.1 hypothetical protein CJP14_08335 [Bacillus velezensis]MCB5334897.1 hypothetical protein [Bacillus amyloliquefaciens]OPD42324.1 hypothetical protein BVF98_14615 [Bacillus amyloliquefaciens]QDK90311.1 hypothetical protein CXB71_10705 [Bacillus velezensis]QZE16225.1 hypothetical protein K4L72_10570 [Bacillus velezensis]
MESINETNSIAEIIGHDKAISEVLLLLRERVLFLQSRYDFEEVEIRLNELMKLYESINKLQRPRKDDENE